MTFIGPKPEVEEPKYVTPFRADGDFVEDANGKRVAEACTEDSSYTDDPQMARAIAEALNEKFGGEKPEAKPEPKLRTLIGWEKYGDEDFIDGLRAYEKTPGRFVWAESRKEVEENRFSGWTLPDNNYRFVDVETGEEVS